MFDEDGASHPHFYYKGNPTGISFVIKMLCLGYIGAQWMHMKAAYRAPKLTVPLKEGMGIIFILLLWLGEKKVEIRRIFKIFSQ